MKRLFFLLLASATAHLYSWELSQLSQVFELPHHNLTRPMLITAIDTLGPKAILAQQYERYEILGKDLVCKCTNDIAAQGATPLFFVDHCVAEKSNLNHTSQRIAGIAAACKQAGCQLLASKNTQLPNAHSNQLYTAGFAVGMANHNQLFTTKNNIEPGDVIIGLPSPGLHLTGYDTVLSLIEQLHIDVLSNTPFASSHQSLLEALLTPATVYAKALTLLQNKEHIKGAVHIATNGLLADIIAAIPEHLIPQLDMHNWYIPPIFRWLKQLGRFTDMQMAQTFNLGIAMALITDKADAQAVIASLAKQGVRASIIGSIESQETNSNPQLKGTIGNSRIRLMVIGESPREDALAQKLAESSFVDLVYISPGNNSLFENEKIKNIRINPLHINALIVYAQQNNIDLVVVGPSAPVGSGIVDEFIKNGIRCFGPSKQAALIETSKIYAKEFMDMHNIPTPSYAVCTTPHEATTYIQNAALPLVIKADGLAAGQGVIIAKSIQSALNHAERLLALHKSIVIEQYIEGQRVNITVISDGETILPLPTCQQYHDESNAPTKGKQIACCPAPAITPELEQKIMHSVIEPALQGLRAQGEPFAGFLYAGIIITPENGITVLEFNCHLKDKEAQSVMAHLKTDLFTLCNAAYNKQLDLIQLKWDV